MINTAYLIVGGVIILYLLFKISELKSRIAKPEYIYVDSSGVSNNPPKFIEVMQNKTINFKVGNETIIMSQITIGRGMTDINIISALLSQLIQQMEIIPKTDLQKMKINLIKSGIYKLMVEHIYSLTKAHAKNKRRYRKELFNIAKENTEYILLIVEQIFDYWIYIKKLIALLARGGSNRMINGEALTWNSYETDLTGQIIIKPRFVLSTN